MIWLPLLGAIILLFVVLPIRKSHINQYYSTKIVDVSGSAANQINELNQHSQKLLLDAAGKVKDGEEFPDLRKEANEMKDIQNQMNKIILLKEEKIRELESERMSALSNWWKPID